MKPPLWFSRCKPLQFLIGKDSRGRWVVQDNRGLCGGLFADRRDALHYALFENGGKPRAVIMVPGVFELNLSQQKLAA